MVDLLFGWASPLLRRGAAAGRLGQEDLLPVRLEDTPSAVTSALWTAWTHVRWPSDAMHSLLRTHACADCISAAAEPPYGEQHCCTSIVQYSAVLCCAALCPPSLRRATYVAAPPCCVLSRVPLVHALWRWAYSRCADSVWGGGRRHMYPPGASCC
jgi:hypothetical protein